MSGEWSEGKEYWIGWLGERAKEDFDDIVFEDLMKWIEKLVKYYSLYRSADMNANDFCGFLSDVISHIIERLLDMQVECGGDE